MYQRGVTHGSFSQMLTHQTNGRWTPLACLASAVWIAAMLLASSAQAWTTVDGVANPQTAALYREWQAASQIPTPHVTIAVQERDCTELGSIACVVGCESGGPMTLVYADPTWLWHEADSPERVADRLAARATFYHELGHVRDCQPRKSRAYREDFASAMGWRVRANLTRTVQRRIDDDAVNVGLYEGWDVCVSLSASSCADPQELFAMASAWCSLNATVRSLDDWASGYGYAPTAAQHREVCELLSGPLR
jgi:hypothetical protein